MDNINNEEIEKLDKLITFFEESQVKFKRNDLFDIAISVGFDVEFERYKNRALTNMRRLISSYDQYVDKEFKPEVSG